MRHRKVLANGEKLPDDRLERFLIDLVNARVAETGEGGAGAEDDTGRIFRLYSTALPTPPNGPQEAQQNSTLMRVLKRRWKGLYNGYLPEGKKHYERGIVGEVRDRLRAIWMGGDTKTAKWRLLRLQSFMQETRAGGSKLERFAPTSPFSDSNGKLPEAMAPDDRIPQAIAYLQRQLGKLKMCTNPNCTTPFFVAKRREDRTCSNPCADEMRGLHKKQWWASKHQTSESDTQAKSTGWARNVPVEPSQIQSTHFTIDESTSKAFVLDVVNVDLSKIDGGGTYFFSRYPRFFPTLEMEIEAMALLERHELPLADEVKYECQRKYHQALIRDLQDGLRSVWHTHDKSNADWAFFRLHSSMLRQMDLSSPPETTLQPPPPHARIHQALRWVRQHVSKLRECRNEDCVHPYFVADTNERFCSKECRHVGEKKSKLRSWEKHKQEWRQKPTQR